MPRAKGAANYKNDTLINIIAEILLNGEYGWQVVAIAYHEKSKEGKQHNTDDLKRHWIKNLCNGTKKPTGKPGGLNDRFHWCISIEKRIMARTHSGMLKLSLDDEDDAPGGKEVDSLGGGLAERGGGQ